MDKFTILEILGGISTVFGALNVGIHAFIQYFKNKTPEKKKLKQQAKIEKLKSKINEIETPN